MKIYPGQDQAIQSGQDLTSSGSAKFSIMMPFELEYIYNKAPRDRNKMLTTDQHGTHPVHVFLGFFYIAAAEVLLHHVLVKSRHGDANEIRR